MKAERKADVAERTEGSNPECVKQAEKPGRSECSGDCLGLRPGHAFMGKPENLGEPSVSLYNKVGRCAYDKTPGVSSEKPQPC